ncbi:hypothetical protein WICMUC_002163 [Wickerhamomyces mucosus]|uniref:Prefoldin subunit 2 n=1 Tax=Wickerhamomyces mucosus TaxID=1378264 RepID=A0A9P8TEQ4_9ASCO|nr:hypothetical protein WICMUC_002163 [Wickerhamomyces mucosus]
MSVNEILQQRYNKYQETITELSGKINELKQDEEEHRIVIKTLEVTPKGRRCFRMVGGALVEHTAGEQLPVLKEKLKNLSAAIGTISKELQKVGEEFEAWKKEKNIKIVKK